METEYLKEIKENLWNIGEDMACEILNAYYRESIRNNDFCIDNEGNSIYNLMDSKQAADAVKAFSFAEISEVFSKKPDWILVVGTDMEAKPTKNVFSTEGPSVVLDRCLRSIICSYCYDPMAYPAFFSRGSGTTSVELMCNGNLEIIKNNSRYGNNT